MEYRSESVEKKLVHSFGTPRRSIVKYPDDSAQRVKWMKHHKCLAPTTRRYRIKSSTTFPNCNNYKYKRRSYRLQVSDIVPKLDATAKICDVSDDSVKSDVEREPSDYLNIIVVDSVVKHLVWIFRQYVRFAKMFGVCSLNIMVIVAVMMLGFADITEGGVCWTVRESNGKCTQRYSNNMSEEECCKHPNFAYTEREMSDVELFFAAAIDDGAVCKSCLDSCEVAKCGSGKRCVYRKGRPKCVCAPVCRSSSKQKNSNHLSSLVRTNQPPVMLPKEQRPFASFFGMSGLDFNNGGGEMTDRRLSSKAPRNINLTQENSEVRWRRNSRAPIAETLRNNSNETEHSAGNKRRKNQRKPKKLSKRRKQSTTPDSLAIPALQPNLRQSKDVEETKGDKRLDESPKSGRIILMAGSADPNWSKVLQQNRKSESSNASQASAIHHNRHHSKKVQQRHHPRANRTSNEDGKKQRLRIESPLLLDDKIRSGFFHHGFPYPSGDEEIAHVSGRFHNPVCGTDGKTYKTECQLKKRACRRESTTLLVAYRGHCQTSCKTVRCLNNLTCVEDQYGLPHCISCTITCPQDDATTVIDPAKAVCGADGLTYKSICDINRLICTTGRSIAVAYHGLCQNEANCNTIQCRDKQICLNDLLTNKPRCISCSFKCPRKRRPQGQRYHEHKVCGTNNLTYHSWCQMRRESCNTGFYIDVKHVGSCQTNVAANKQKLPAS